jgi:hypothetical protein
MANAFAFAGRRSIAQTFARAGAIAITSATDWGATWQNKHENNHPQKTDP